MKKTFTGKLHGASHEQGGVAFKMQGTDKPYELEGGEFVVNKKSMASPKKKMLNGRPMTNEQIVEKINNEQYYMERGGHIISAGNPYLDIIFGLFSLEKRMAKGGKLPRIEDVEDKGEELDGYLVDESQAVSNAGDAILYNYKGNQYEIVEWRQEAEKHAEGAKTISLVGEEMAKGGGVNKLKVGKFVKYKDLFGKTKVGLVIRMWDDGKGANVKSYQKSSDGKNYFWASGSVTDERLIKILNDNDKDVLDMIKKSEFESPKEAKRYFIGKSSTKLKR